MTGARVTDHLLTTEDGFGLAVQVTGRDDAPALLLLPGQANSHRWWRDLRAAFDQHHRVVTFDPRGTGGSRGPVGEWSTRSFADDAAAVVAQHAAGRAHVFGTSMGGRVAQRLAADHPEVVARLVLACTSPGGPHAQERSTEVRRRLADPDPRARLRALQELFYTDAWPHPPRASPLFGDPTMSRDESRAHLRVSARHDAWADLPRVTAPTLVLHGTDDLMSPVANAELLGGRIPGAEVVLDAGGRHGFFHEHADPVTARVLDFLAG